MPRVSKRTKKAETQPQIKYYRTYIYLRLSEKDGGHGRRDSIYIQKQICVDFAKKHPEMLIMKVYTDNGVTGTTFERKAFEELMTDVRAGKVDCIIVKDFSRFGRDALDAVDLIDVIFPTLDVRFISVLDEYDSENPACVQDRVTNILKHFMNDYYAREVSSKLIQAHKISREKENIGAEDLHMAMNVPKITIRSWCRRRQKERLSRKFFTGTCLKICQAMIWPGN